jgi:hypothetical protein
MSWINRERTRAWEEFNHDFWEGVMFGGLRKGDGIISQITTNQDRQLTQESFKKAVNELHTDVLEGDRRNFK